MLRADSILRECCLQDALCRRRAAQHKINTFAAATRRALSGARRSRHASARKDDAHTARYYFAIRAATLDTPFCRCLILLSAVIQAPYTLCYDTVFATPRATAYDKRQRATPRHAITISGVTDLRCRFRSSYEDEEWR